jgi:hypothetical protein
MEVLWVHWIKTFFKILNFSKYIPTWFLYLRRGNSCEKKEYIVAMNEDVLLLILKEVDCITVGKLLKTTRLVCKDWNEVSRGAWQGCKKVRNSVPVQ